MRELSWTFEHKTDWGSGSWQDEPDKVQWQDTGTGLPCLILRNRSGAWCGYVGVSKDHPAFEQDYDRIDVEVHGGLTFSGPCQPPHEQFDNNQRICHVVEPGEDDNVWWVGFDCAHAFDYCPACAKYGPEFAPIDGGDPLLRETYKDINYVRHEVTELAAQLGAKT